jgi:predicted transcriptional regulator
MAQAHLYLHLLEETLTPDQIGAKINRSGKYVQRVVDGRESLKPTDAERILAISAPQNGKDSNRQTPHPLVLRSEAVELIVSSVELGLTKVEIAKLAGISRPTLLGVINGISAPRDETLLAILNARDAIVAAAGKCAADRSRKAETQAEKIRQREARANVRALKQARKAARVASVLDVSHQDDLQSNDGAAHEDELGAERETLRAEAAELILSLANQGLTQPEIATFAGCHASVLYQIVRSRYHNFQIETFRKVLALRDYPVKAAIVAARIAEKRAI